MTLEPYLIWWDSPTCTFVEDAKNKNLTGRRVPNGDLYQIPSCATALDLPAGLLVYAQGEMDDESYEVRDNGKRLTVTLLDLAGTLDQTLKKVRRMAGQVVLLCDAARRAGT